MEGESIILSKGRWKKAALDFAYLEEDMLPNCGIVFPE
jgi:hypothetical protein